MKVCSKCKKEKPLSDFHKKSTTKDGYSYHCKECQRSYVREHYKQNTQYYLDKAAQRRLTRAEKHGLTEDELAELTSKYDGKCWVCKEEEAVHVDHDHACCPSPNQKWDGKSCGKCVRGVLCPGCNLGLGNFKDSVSKLLAAVEYLNAYVA